MGVTDENFAILRGFVVFVGETLLKQSDNSLCQQSRLIWTVCRHRHYFREIKFLDALVWKRFPALESIPERNLSISTSACNRKSRPLFLECILKGFQSASLAAE